MISLKTAIKWAMIGCITVAAFSVGMSIWSIINGDKIGLGTSFICLGMMIACALINYRNLKGL